MNNAGFESGLVDWNALTGNETITNDAFTGTNALQLSVNGSGVDQNFRAVAGETYTLSGYAKTTETDWNGMGLSFFDADWTLLDKSSIQITEENWTEYTLDAIAPTGAVNGVLWAWKEGDNGTTVLDDLGVSSATPPPPPPTPTNGELLSNHSFEFGIVSWSSFRGTETITTDEAIDGNQSLALTSNGSGTSQSTAVSAGETYQLSLFAKTNSPGWSGFGLDFLDSNGNKVASDVEQITTTDWSNYQVNYTAPSEAVRANVWAWKGGNQGSTYVDGISLQLIPETNQSPTITSNGGTDSANLDIVENRTTITNIDATDPEGDSEGNGLSFSLEGPDIGLVSINPNTGELNFNTAPDFEAPADSNGDNQYNVDVVVTDSQGGQDIQSLAINITDEVETTPAEQYRYIRFVANSEVNGKPWTSLAELNVLDGNGDRLNQSNWSLVSVDSQETVAEDGAAIYAFDNNPSTFWHTEWAAPGDENDPAHDHEIVIDLGGTYDLSGFSYLPRQDGGVNGRVASYQFFASENITNWNGALSTGIFANVATEQTVQFLDNPAPTTGLVGYWQFNELTPTAPVVDASGNGYNGSNININPGITSASGPVNSAPIFETFNPRSGNFDGVNDYVSIGNSPALDFSDGQFTQSVWIRPTANDANFRGILGYQNGGSQNRAPGLWTIGRKIHGGFGDGTNWNNFTTDDVLRLNEWNHVVSSFDGNSSKIYVDGQEVYATTDFAGLKPLNVQQLNIGRVDNYFKGQIDEVRLYNRSLGIDEIQQLYVEQPGQAQVGDWSSPINFPNIPVAAAVLPNGKVVTWSSWDRFTFGGNGPRQSYTSIWDPVTGEVSEVLVTNTDHDMFCPGIAMLPDGRLLVNGGGEFVTSTSIYDFNTETWSDGPDMEYRRWYNSSLTLADGDVFTIGGERSNSSGARITTGLGEVFDLTSGWRTLNGAPIAPIANVGDRGTEHPQIFLAPNGKVFAAGPSPTMYWYDTTGNGSITAAGQRGDSPYSQVGMSVMYDTGKILFAGGSLVYDQSGFTGYNAAYTIDINNENAIAVDKQDPMSYKRVYGTGVVLPNGQVLAIGGQQDTKAFTDTQAVYRPELWDPETGDWTLMDNHEIPRTYHSVSLLLPDGRVMSGGGGLAGAGSPVNHPDVEIFTPPYLYNDDGTLADRPVIGNGPNRVEYDQAFSITMETDVPIETFNLVRMSAVTHGVNTDQRFLSVDFSVQGINTYSLNAPDNGNIAPPGYYMLFALDSNGVPSVAKTIQIV